MNISRIATRAGRLLADNSPAILTAVGVVGTVTTAYLAGRATWEAAYETCATDENEHRQGGRMMTHREVIEKHWKLYIPAATTGVTTVACIVMANRIGTRRAAALAAGYTILEGGFSEYKAKVVEKIGEKKETEIRDEIAQDRVNRKIPLEALIIGEGKVPCLEATSGRYWPCSMEDLHRAENAINKKIHMHDSATVDDFYDLVGLESTSISGDLGWNHDKTCELHIAATIPDSGPYQGKPVLVVDFASMPIPEHWRYV